VPMHGRPSAEIVADLVPAAGVAAAVARIEELEVEAVTEGVEPVPGALDLLGSLAAGRWAVVTSASRRLAGARLAAVGIRPATVIAADDITRGKPDPEPFLLAAARLGVAPERCVVFEDAPAGLASGRAAGMWTVALTTSHPAPELTADAVVADLTAVSVQVSGDALEVRIAD
ncbi:HAD-IA family hydrolase, partial [Streptomyces diastaticus]